MDVILLERIKYLGEMGAIVSVKPGYARNYLIPTKKALRANEENKAYFLARKAELEAVSAEKLLEAKEVYAIIDKNFITIIRQAGEDGKLFGSVSPRDITENISNTFKQSICHSKILVGNPIKYMGIHEVTVNLHADLHATMYINVSRTINESEEAKKEFLAIPTEKAEQA